MTTDAHGGNRHDANCRLHGRVRVVVPINRSMRGTTHRNVRLKDDESGDTNAPQQPGEEAAIVVFD